MCLKQQTWWNIRLHCTDIFLIAPRTQQDKHNYYTILYNCTSISWIECIFPLFGIIIARRILPIKLWSTIWKWCMNWSRGTKIGHQQSCGLWLMSLTLHMRFQLHTLSEEHNNYVYMCIYIKNIMCMCMYMYIHKEHVLALVSKGDFTCCFFFQGCCKFHQEFGPYKAHYVCW